MTSSIESVVSAGFAAQDAVALGNGVFMAKGVANAYLITTDGGDVLINTGLASLAPEFKRRFAAVSDHPIRKIIFTQGHPDHIGGWAEFTGPEVETIAQAAHADVREYWRGLRTFISRRNFRLWWMMMKNTGGEENRFPREAENVTTFHDSYAFELGSRRFELYATPDGETLDALIVWMPQDKTVFVGNFMGPMFGHVPNLYTIRGDKIRSAIRFIHGCDRILALEPEILINGHDKVEGKDEIRQQLLKVRNGTQYIRDQTFEAINADKSLWQMMDEITLPPELQLGEMHGKVPWLVRAIYEEHVGWFRYESTTELYSVPVAAVASDLVDLAGADKLCERAAQHVAGGEPLHALHLIEPVLAVEPDNAAANQVKIDAHQQLLEASGGVNHSEVQWLKSEIATAEKALAE